MLGRLLLIACVTRPCLALARPAMTSDAAGNIYFDTADDHDVMINGASLLAAIQQQVDARVLGRPLNASSPTTTCTGAALYARFGADFSGNLHVNMTNKSAELFVNGVALKNLVEHQADQASSPATVPITRGDPSAAPAVGFDTLGNFHINTTNNAQLHINGVALGTVIQRRVEAWESQQKNSFTCIGATVQTTGWYNPISGPVVEGEHAYIVTAVQALAYHIPSATVQWQRTITNGNGRDNPNRPLVDTEYNQLIFGWDHGVRALHLNNGSAKWQYEYPARTFQDEGPHFVVQPVLYGSAVCSTSQFYAGLVLCLSRQTGRQTRLLNIPNSRDTRDLASSGSKLVVSANQGNAVVVDLAPSTPKVTTRHWHTFDVCNRHCC